MGTMFLIHSVLTKFKFQSATGSYDFNVAKTWLCPADFKTMAGPNMNILISTAAKTTDK